MVLSTHAQLALLTLPPPTPAARCDTPSAAPSYCFSPGSRPWPRKNNHSVSGYGMFIFINVITRKDPSRIHGSVCVYYCRTLGSRPRPVQKQKIGADCLLLQHEGVRVGGVSAGICSAPARGETIADPYRHTIWSKLFNSQEVPRSWRFRVCSRFVPARGILASIQSFGTVPP